MITDQESPDPSGKEFIKDAKNHAAVTHGEQLAGNSVCSSAKQHRKMMSERLDGQGDGISFSYSWSQTETDVAVTLKVQGLSDEQTRAFDVSFTSKEVNIRAGDKTKVIYFHGDIQKEESRVQATKGSIILRVAKQSPSWWPHLESSTKRQGGATEEILPGSDIKSGQDKENAVAVAKDSSMESSQEDTKADISENIKEKEEEPVYRLNHLKHDFYERGPNLTLSVFTKSLNKDEVKVNFSKKGFVLKFQTSDAKFLQLHEGTTSETAFTWPVTTRQEIIPEDCKFTVKSAVIEIILKKTSPDRWTSLEATQRKEKSECSQSDTWIPINARAAAAPAPSSLTASSSATSSSSSWKALSLGDNKQQAASAVRPSGGVAFDDLSEINVNLRGAASQRMAESSSNRHQQEEDEDGPTSSSSENSQKPMAKVLPLNNHTPETIMLINPGFAGLVNIGNTCFMNCVLQVLANTREFRDFFLDGRYQDDINEDNPLGMRGELAAMFGVLLRWLWSCKKHYWDPRRLKDLVAKKNPQFFGYAQHDAHEFLAFLLDGLHEDLNRIKKKPYTETIDSDGRPDRVVAEEAWAQYKLRNDSVVVDLFQGQLKSKLVCPRCGKVSITFDPFLYMSVPLPKKKKVIPASFTCLLESTPGRRFLSPRVGICR
ncbi:ubiquitin carboxyl-terminal hydrolase 19 [Elysia marginata]|uniref:ubiquitinyl hydrolase 1 n=1 Tax=Elysia marginata TaxID=1093978 RepID=A0AAV4GG97_9GAST|nr:ubiquitin carboxyl-terminal hydrolase 19 [Elysia marginata]